MTTVEIGPPLRMYCDGRKELCGRGASVLEVLRDACSDYPSLRSIVLRSETEISSRVFLYGCDGSVISKNRETAPVGEEGRLRVYLLVAGG
jgi:hypothetical protein